MGLFQFVDRVVNRWIFFAFPPNLLFLAGVLVIFGFVLDCYVSAMRFLCFLFLAFVLFST